MRLAIVSFIAALAFPALAQEWGDYVNSRFGYVGMVPPGFFLVSESDNGDGAIFDHAGTVQSLAFWGAHMMEESFEAEVEASMGYTEGDGFNISFSTVTPEWATFSGVSGQQQIINRMILLCDRASYASFSLKFSSREAVDIKDIAQRLAQAFRPTDC
jgi:hypothetical protein